MRWVILLVVMLFLSNLLSAQDFANGIYNLCLLRNFSYYYSLVLVESTNHVYRTIC